MLDTPAGGRLHDLRLSRDAHNAHQRPKIETHGNSLFIAAHTAQEVDGHALGETHSVRRAALPGHRAPWRVAELRPGAPAAGARPEMLAHGLSVALHAVLDSVVDNYQPIVCLGG